MFLTKGRLKLLLQNGKMIKGIDHIRYSMDIGVVTYTIGDSKTIIDANEVTCVISN